MKVLWSVMSLFFFKEFTSFSWQFWLFSHLLSQEILHLELIDLSCFSLTINYVLQGLFIRAFTASVQYYVSKCIWHIICITLQINYLLNLKFTFFSYHGSRSVTSYISFSYLTYLPLILGNITFTPNLIWDQSLCVVGQ